MYTVYGVLNMPAHHYISAFSFLPFLKLPTPHGCKFAEEVPRDEGRGHEGEVPAREVERTDEVC